MAGHVTTASLGDWVAEELRSDHPDTVFITRTITQETGRWFHDRSADGLENAVCEPARTGDPRWDALIEGIIRYRMAQTRLPPPSWTEETTLETGWSPNDHLYPDDRWRLLNVFHTPAELLEKGVVFARHNLDRL
ncbi:MAG: hypothetical protein Q4G67_11160 [Actinomycetia bacterium]|nr:hypothetical protein [Actinomycetes bacterium]